MIKAVIFDFFGVLCTSQLNIMYLEFWGDKPAELEKAKQLIRQTNLGLKPYDEVVHELAEMAGLSYQAAKDMLGHNSANKPLLNYIRTELKPKYKIGVLSNSSGDGTKKYFQKADAELFDSVVLSYREGVVKPDKEIYLIAASRLGVKPEECVFVDDTDRQAAGAVNAGMRAIVYQDFASLKASLEKLLTDSNN